MKITLYLPIHHGVNCLNTALPQTHHQPPHPSGIAIGALSIQDGRVFGMAQAIRALEQGGFDFMLLTETKIYTE